MSKKGELFELLSEASASSAEEYLDHKFNPDTITTDEGEETKLYHAYMPTEVDEYEEYYDIVKLLRSNCTSGNFIKLYVAGWGGCTMLGTSLINAINASPAQIQTIVTGDVYSMHTVIALSQAKNLIIEPGVQFMFHESQLGVVGGVSNNLRDLLAAKNSDRMMNKHVKPYLTQKEFDEMNNGLNIYITGTEMKKRIDAKLQFKTKRTKKTKVDNV